MHPLRIGTQGWNYTDWVGPFYPEGTRPARFLELYARAFDTVEVDSTFYAVPSPSTVEGWAERTPDDFTFTLKLPGEITHEARLRGSEALLAEFWERVRLLGAKLGPVLVQMGPDFGPRERPALADFLAGLPDDVRVAVEFRHPGWAGDDTLALLAEHGVAFTLSDGPWIPRARLREIALCPTVPFHYLRWMGPDRALTDHSRVQTDRGAEADAWAATLAPLLESGTEVWAYTSNFWEGHAPASAAGLQRRLGQLPVDSAALVEQTSLF
jgi:uncharacterized protein YecE (DUF72 family)